MLYQLSYSRSLPDFLAYLPPTHFPFWWAVRDLNLRLLACEASALPLS
jgi:hypothetical protein